MGRVYSSLLVTDALQAKDCYVFLHRVIEMRYGPDATPTWH